MTRLAIDRDEIAKFTKAIFCHVSDGQTIALRTYPDNGDKFAKATFIEYATVNGHGLEPVIEVAAAQAQRAADHPEPQVFCPPIAAFFNEQEPWRAREQDLTEGLAVSVECDRQPMAAKEKLAALLGPATVVVESGGLWLDSDTGERQPKLHLHWRLNEPATDGDLKRLKQARRLATKYVGGDHSNITIVHPIRWPGSVHRKNEPKLARIVEHRPDQEIDLGKALDLLQLAAADNEPESKPNGSRFGFDYNEAGKQYEREDERSTPELIRLIATGEKFHDATVSLSARFIGSGMPGGAVVKYIREVMQEIPPEQRDFRWQCRFDDVPRIVQTAEEYCKRQQNADASGLVFVSLDSVQPEPVEWVWDRRVARRKLTLVAGDPGIGKSQLGNDIIARTTTGRAWPDGGKAPVGRCLILSAEDGVADTIRPRLEAAGAELSKVEVLTAVVTDDGKRRSFNLQQDLEALERKVRAAGDVMLVKIDPLTSYMGSGVDSHRTTDVRAVLEPVAAFAERNNVAVLAITHPPKAAQSKAIHAFTGSLAFAAAARIALLAVEEPETDRRLLLSVKNNIGPAAAGIAYRLEQKTVTNNVVGSHVIWDSEPVTMTANEAMRSGGNSESKVADAEDLLREELANGPVSADELIAKAARGEISEKTLRRAKKKLGIKASKGDFFGGWKWELPA